MSLYLQSFNVGNIPSVTRDIYHVRFQEYPTSTSLSSYTLPSGTYRERGSVVWVWRSSLRIPGIPSYLPPVQVSLYLRNLARKPGPTIGPKVCCTATPFPIHPGSGGMPSSHWELQLSASLTHVPFISAILRSKGALRMNLVPMALGPQGNFSAIVCLFPCATVYWSNGFYLHKLSYTSFSLTR